MSCIKRTFYTAKEARERAQQINDQNRQYIGQQKKRLRHYKCHKCGYYHLTKSTKKQHQNNVKRMKTDDQARREIRERAFIAREAYYWEQHFNSMKK